MQPRVSVVTTAFRAGGIDIMMAGMRDQTYGNFEVILVDRRYERRHDRVVQLAKDYGIRNFTHTPEYRRNGKWVVFCSGWNTGFMMAEGELVIMLLDYSYAPPGWIERHLRHHFDGEGNRLPKKLVMAPHIYLTLPPIVFKKQIDVNEWLADQAAKRDHCVHQPDFGELFDEMGIFVQPFDPSWLPTLRIMMPPHQDPKMFRVPGPIGYNYMHAKNESFLLDSVLDINGLDEAFEQGRGPMDNEFGFRFWKSGCELLLDWDARVWCINPRFIMASPPWGDRDVSVEGRWSYNQGVEYQNQRYAEIEAGARPWANNGYNLGVKRIELLKWKGLDVIPTDGLDIAKAGDGGLSEKRER